MNAPIYMEERLPYLAANADLSECGAAAASEYLTEAFTRAIDVKNEDCVLIQREPVVAASVKSTTLWFYIFIQNELNLFEGGLLASLENKLREVNKEIGQEINQKCGCDHPKPRLTEFLVSLNISRQVP